MCGRYTLKTSGEELTEAFGLDGADNIEPRHNIAPSQSVLSVRQVGEKRELVALKWGLVPSWSKDVSIGNRLINARAETLDEKPSFRAAFKQRRCIVPADGFYEWDKRGKLKQPYYVRMKDKKVFGIAALWESREGADGYLETCALITTEPNAMVSGIHNRMPVILPQEKYRVWLETKNQIPANLKNLLKPYPEGEMEMFAVSKSVNSPKSLFSL